MYFMLGVMKNNLPCLEKKTLLSRFSRVWVHSENKRKGENNPKLAKLETEHGPWHGMGRGIVMLYTVGKVF